MRAPHHDLTITRACFLSLLAALFLALLPSPSQAQSKQTAGRLVGLDFFGAVSDTDTAYYGTNRQIGYMAGIDYTQFRFLPRLNGRITPSLEVRGTLTPGTPVAERTLEGGIKVAYNYHKLHPYGSFFLGGGEILFTPPAPLEPGYIFASDSSFLYVYGGGLTYDVLPKFSILADYTHQSWNLGFDPPVTFTPQSVSLGVVYHFRLKPFRNR